MEERRFSSPTRTTAPSAGQQPSSSPPSREASFVGMSRPPLLGSPSMRDAEEYLSTDTIKPRMRKVQLEVEILDPPSSPESPSRPKASRKTSIKGTLYNVLHTRKMSREPAPGPPELSCGESSQSEESSPPTPFTALSNGSCTALVVDPEEEERRERERQEFFERHEIYRDRSQFDHRRQFIPHHPFSKEEVPYMQSYSHVSLHNDYYTYNLLHYLTPSGSPTFHDFGSKPPRDVLDLGCGEGYWAVEAATIWRAAGTYVTAFDIVDLGRPLRRTLEPELAKQIIWVKGNFLKQILPFPPKSFDLVRMANLALAVPQDRWTHLLEEVRRILRPGGVVEIVDDEVFFPNIQPSPSVVLSRTSSLKERRKPASDAAEQEFEKGIWKPLPPCPPLPPASLPRSDSTRRRGPLADFETRSTTARTMETVFQKMLRDNYNVPVSAHQTLKVAIQQVFGNFSVDTKRLSVPTRDLSRKKSRAEDDSPQRAVVEAKAHKPRKGRHSLDSFVTDFTPPAYIAPKAMQLLQPQVCGDPRCRRPYQPTGFVVIPSTFIPCDPDVLEMHSCRNMHILLSCKDALARFISQHVDDTGEPFVSHEEFEQLMFEYDTFKRQRMNWPQDYPGVNHEEGPLSPSPSRPTFSLPDLAGLFRSPSAGVALNAPVNDDDAIPIRRVRAFIALKV